MWSTYHDLGDFWVGLYERLLEELARDVSGVLGLRGGSEGLRLAELEKAHCCGLGWNPSRTVSRCYSIGPVLNMEWWQGSKLRSHSNRGVRNLADQKCFKESELLLWVGCSCHNAGHMDTEFHS